MSFVLLNVKDVEIEDGERRSALAVVYLVRTHRHFFWMGLELSQFRFCVALVRFDKKGHISVDDSIWTSSTREAVATLAQLLDLSRFNQTIPNSIRPRSAKLTGEVTVQSAIRKAQRRRI
jgi:hypothetical protein